MTTNLNVFEVSEDEKMIPTSLERTPFTQDIDRKRMLCSMSEPVLLSMISDRAQQADLQWLALMKEAGFFDADVIDEHVKTAYEITEEWALRCDAALDVMKRATLPKENADAGTENSCPPAAVFVLEAPTASFFADLCLDMSMKLDEWRENAIEVSSLAYVALKKAMALSTMLDRADVLEEMLQAHPLDEDPFFEEEKFGHQLFRAEHKEADSMLVGPLFCALQFSSKACVKLLLTEKALSEPLYQIEFKDQLNPVSFMQSLKDLKHRCGVEIARSFLDAAFIAQEDSEVMGAALQDAMVANMMRANGVAIGENAHLMSAFLESNIQDLNQNRSLRQAVVHGWPEVINHMKGDVNWDAYWENRPRQSLPCKSPAEQAIENGCISGLQALIEVVNETGHVKQFLNGFVFREGVLATRMAEDLVFSPQGMELLPHLLNMGLDPDMTHNPRLPKTLVETASAQNTDGYALGIINSFRARQQARALINEIEKNEKNEIIKTGPTAPCFSKTKP